ncbi:hypothetical protein [Thermoflexus sp.]|uniref:hypothetical protein n=1 Tax=Thermoflexus sp. TaxID=1969742 RepID=UPI002ADE8494|nr:hypothetical protein [Thermoflexus sp.]
MRPIGLRRLLLVFLSTLGLSGCLTLEVRTRLSPDGSAERAVVIAVDSVLLQTAAVDPMESLRTRAEASGWRVERYQDPARGQEGLRLHRTLAALEDLNHLAEGDPLAGLEQITVGEEGDFRTLSVTLSISGILDRLRIAAGEPPFSEEDLSLLRAADLPLVYELELPGPIVEHSPHSGAQIEGRRIRWAIPLRPDQPVVTLYAAWRPARSIPSCPGSWIGLAAVGGAILRQWILHRKR